MLQTEKECIDFLYLIKNNLNDNIVKNSIKILLNEYNKIRFYSPIFADFSLIFKDELITLILNREEYVLKMIRTIIFDDFTDCRTCPSFIVFYNSIKIVEERNKLREMFNYHNEIEQNNKISKI